MGETRTATTPNGGTMRAPRATRNRLARVREALAHAKQADEHRQARRLSATDAATLDRVGLLPPDERDRRALAILNDPTVPAGTRHVLANGIRLLHKLERPNER